MKRFLAIGATALLAVAPLTTAAEAGKKYGKVKGHVIQVEERVRTANGGELDRLTIRTRNGEELRLNLGQGGACEGCYQVGDRIRAKVHAGDGSGAGLGVRSAKVKRAGEMRGYVNAGGKMVPSRSPAAARAAAPEGAAVAAGGQVAAAAVVAVVGAERPRSTPRRREGGA